MNRSKPPLLGDATDEVSGLIEALHESARRLEELTAGEVDTVADRDGRTFLLRPAQDYLRHNEAAKQAALLNALPAHVCLLDAHGGIIAVNEAWRRFADANAFLDSHHGVGRNYLAVCDAVCGDDASTARQASTGIRSVLQGEAEGFAIAYPCHSATEQRWFRMTVAPLAEERANGAVVMHVDLTAMCQTEERLRSSELRFRQMADNISDVFFLFAVDSQRMLYVSPAYEQIWGRSCESLYANPQGWIEAIHPDDQAASDASYRQATSVGTFRIEHRIVRPDGSIRWIESRGFPVSDDAGLLVRIAGVCQDITERKKAAQQLHDSQQRLNGIVSAAMDAIVTADEEGRIVLGNPAAAIMFGYPAAELQGMPLDRLLPARFRARHATQIAAFAEAGITSRRMGALSPVSGLRKNGEEFPIEASISRDESTGRRFFTAILRDVTERTRSDERIRRFSRMYSLLSGINTLIVRVRDRDELFREACRIACERGRFRMSMIAIVDPRTIQLVSVASAGKDETLLAAIQKRLSSPEGATKTLVARAILERKPFVSNDSSDDPRLVFSTKYAEAGVHSMAILPLMVAQEAVGVLALYASERDFFQEGELKLLTELAGDVAFAIDHLDKQERLDYLAYYDVLTGLANRSLLIERLALYLRTAVSGECRLALFLIDLERFKNINDSLGQPAGDALLRQVAAWLTRRTGDANLLARVGADRFAVLLPEVRPEGNVAHLFEKAMDAFLSHPFCLNDAIFRIAFKGGAALFPDDGADAETLFRNAEAALKKAKASGERYLFYTPAMTATVASRLTLENQLRRALEKQEFVLHYQPKVNLASGQVTGAEALIRWNDPHSGLVAPGRFIPVLEETGLIHEVGRWALQQAVEDHRRWRAAGLASVRIAVNVSPLQLGSRDFIAEIAQAISIDTQAAAGLELEITESVIMADIRHSIAGLQAIRAMGVSIAIDDFGTGFSSLSYLAKLPVDTLKIDRSFVTDMTATPQGLALVSTIINLAHALKLKVVAEGVETDEQSHLLRLLNCDEMQGFLFSRAVPCEIFEASFLVPPAAV